jgi:hypothetical protein
MLFSQTKNVQITGTIKSADEKEVLESATVHLERLKDSSIVTYTITDAKGNFKINANTSDTKIKLIVSFIGFKPYSKIIAVKEQQVGDLYLKTANTLDAIVICTNNN